MEVNIVKFFQKASCSFLDGVNSVITVIGETSMLFMLFVAIYLCYRKEFAVKYLFFFMLSGLINGAIKSAVARPRPYTYDGVLDVRHTTGYSFPSGHSQNYALQATLIGIEYSKYEKRNSKRWILYSSLIVVGLLVAISRIYLGQHFLTDVLVGLCLGTILAFGFETLFNLIPQKFKKIVTTQSVLLGLIPIAMILIVIIEYLNLGSESMLDMFYTYLAIYVGLVVGYSVDKAYINYKEDAVWYVQLCKIVIAVLGIVTLSFAFDWVSNQVVRNFYFYLTSTLYVTLVLPLLFKLIFKDKYLKQEKAKVVKNKKNKKNKENINQEDSTDIVEVEFEKENN